MNPPPGKETRVVTVEALKGTGWVPVLNKAYPAEPQQEPILTASYWYVRGYDVRITWEHSPAVPLSAIAGEPAAERQ